MTTPARPFSSQDDEIIRKHWGKSPSPFIADLLQRNPGAVRARAQKLKLTHVSSRNWKARPSNRNAVSRKPAKPKLKTPGLPQLSFLNDVLAHVPVATTIDLRMRAQDFLRWRREVHGI